MNPDSSTGLCVLMEDSSSHSQLMVTPAFEGWFMSHQRSSVMKWLLNILLSSLLSCLSGAICAVPVGCVGSRGGACRLFMCYIHEHMLTSLMYGCVHVLFHSSVLRCQAHSELGPWRTGTSHREGSVLGETRSSAVCPHTHSMCIHVSQKLKSSRPQTGSKVLLPKGRDPDNQRGSTEKNIRTSSKSAVKSIKARSLEAPTAGPKLLVLKTDKLTN